jgi:hypothetical protein
MRNVVSIIIALFLVSALALTGLAADQKDKKPGGASNINNHTQEPDNNAGENAGASKSGNSQKPPYKVLPLSCSTGLFGTDVKNPSKTNVPQDAVITVHGIGGKCTYTANGPLAPGKIITFLGCPEEVTKCVASAKWQVF